MRSQTIQNNYPIYFGLITILVGLAVLIGWIWDITFLKSVFPDHITMRANTAFGMIFCGLSVLFLSLGSTLKQTKIVVSILNTLVLAVALLTLADYFLQINFRFHEILFKDSSNLINPGRMSPTTAFCFLSFGVSTFLLLLDKEIYFIKSIAAALSTTVLILSGLIALGCIVNLFFEFKWLTYTNVSIHTSLLFILLSLSQLVLIHKKMNFKWTLNTSLTGGYVLWFISLMVISFAYYNSISQIKTKNEEIIFTQKTLNELKNLMTYLKSTDEHTHNEQQIAAYINDLDKLVDETDQNFLNSLHDTIQKAKHQGKNIGQDQEVKAALLGILNQFYAKQEQLFTNQEITLNTLSSQALILSPISIFLSITLLSIGLFILNASIAEKKQLESQLRQSQKLSAIGQLTGGVAHDFNNILGIILGNMDLLERSVSGNEEALKRIKNTLNAAKRGADLTNRLLAFSWRQQLHPSPTVLADSINNVIALASRILDKNIHLVSHCDPAIPPTLIDTTELESALLNLAINARDAMPQGGTLVFSTKLFHCDTNDIAVQAGEIKPGTYAGISVTDNGEGIPPEVLEHVFEPFFTTKKRGKGTGMGLSIVYGFIKQSGGFVRVASEVGQGTTVTLYLPIIDTTITKKEEPKPLANHQKFSGEVLLVDDERELLEIASVYLKEMGFNVLSAVDGNSALNIFEKKPDISLLVTDIIMPGMNGIVLAKKIRQLKEQMIVVYTSGFPTESITQKTASIDEIIINKPYNRDAFVAQINQAMQKKVDDQKTH